MVDLQEIKLPILTADEAWLEKMEGVEKIPDKIKRLFYLPSIAYKTAVYKNENELTHFQKDRLILLFRNEAEQAFIVVHNQVLLIVGNAPADRIEYLKAFESWKERLIELLEKSINCITKEQWIKEFTSSFPSKEQLAIEGKLTAKGKLTVEGKEQFEEIIQRYCKKLQESVFDERIYLNKFSKFIIEANGLLRRFSIMHSITMERTEWIIKGLENIGKLPENAKIALKKNNSGKTGTKKSLDMSSMSPEARVLAVYANSPDLSMTKIAKQAGVNRTCLYRMGKFLTVKRMREAEEAESYKDSIPKGEKDGKTGEIEAWREEIEAPEE